MCMHACIVNEAATHPPLPPPPPYQGAPRAATIAARPPPPTPPPRPAPPPGPPGAAHPGPPPRDSGGASAGSGRWRRGRRRRRGGSCLWFVCLLGGVKCVVGVVVKGRGKEGGRREGTNSRVVVIKDHTQRETPITPHIHTHTLSPHHRHVMRRRCVDEGRALPVVHPVHIAAPLQQETHHLWRCVSF